MMVHRLEQKRHVPCSEGWVTHTVCCGDELIYHLDLYNRPSSLPIYDRNCLTSGNRKNQRGRERSIFRTKEFTLAKRQMYVKSL